MASHVGDPRASHRALKYQSGDGEDEPRVSVQQWALALGTSSPQLTAMIRRDTRERASDAQWRLPWRPRDSTPPEHGVVPPGPPTGCIEVAIFERRFSACQLTANVIGSWHPSHV